MHSLSTFPIMHIISTELELCKVVLKNLTLRPHNSHTEIEALEIYSDEGYCRNVSCTLNLISAFFILSLKQQIYVCQNKKTENVLIRNFIIKIAKYLPKCYFDLRL